MNTQKVVSRVTRRQLLVQCQKAGMRLYGGDPASADETGQQLPLTGEPSKLLFSLSKLYDVQGGRNEAPQRLNFYEMMAIGGGLCTAEESIAYLLAYYQEHGRMPTSSGRLRCRNKGPEPFSSLYVSWKDASGYDLYVGYVRNDRRYLDLDGLHRESKFWRSVLFSM